MRMSDKQVCTSIVNVRVSKELKKESQELFDSLGLNMSTAINIFLKKSLEVGGIPFELNRKSSNDHAILSMADIVASVKNQQGRREYMEDYDDEMVQNCAQ